MENIKIAIADDNAGELATINTVLAEKAKNETFKKRIHEMEDFIKQQDSKITEYDEALVRKYIKEIVIYDDKFHVIFKNQELKLIFLKTNHITLKISGRFLGLSLFLCAD